MCLGAEEPDPSNLERQAVKVGIQASQGIATQPSEHSPYKRGDIWIYKSMEGVLMVEYLSAAGCKAASRPGYIQKGGKMRFGQCATSIGRIPSW